MGEIFETEALEWQPVRPDVTREVYGKTLLEDDMKIVLTRVAPGGSFAPHRDPYGHLFYFLAGSGIVRVGDRKTEAGPGLAVRVAPGEPHSYENTGSDDLMLISVNLPPESGTSLHS